MRDDFDRSTPSRRARVLLVTGALALGSVALVPPRGLAQDASEDVDEAAEVVEIGMKVGQLHPWFRLPAADGAEGKFHSITDYRGRRLLLFHFASW